MGKLIPGGNCFAGAFLCAPFGLAASNHLEEDSMRNQKSHARLENWAVVGSANVASYQALQAGNLLVGKVFSHPRIGEGRFIFSSPIERFDTETNVVETKNTTYRLGEASRDYKLWLREQTTGAAA